MKTWIYTFLLVMAVLPALAQYSVSGIVTNAAGEPLVQASVFVVESQYATITDDRGYYIIEDLEAGEHTLKASYVGYESFVQYLDLKESIVVDIDLGDNNLYLNMVQISTNRVDEDGVFASTTLDKADVEKDNLGQDLPYLLRWTPSAVVTSDAGTGIGYTGIRIRGTDATRVNVTINGVPLNDSESQGVFWVNLPDFGSSVDDVQIQRGVGTSTNGAGAFGGTISLMTNKINQNNYIHANGTLGSFGTRKANFAMGTGLINNKYTIDGRYSVIKSDGFIDRGSADLRSYYLSAARVTDKSSLQFVSFSGSEVTYQAWYGVPEAKVQGDTEGELAHFEWNQSFLYPTPQDSANYFENGRDYNFYQYENQVDDYNQSHYQLHHVLSLNDKMTIKTTGYYVKGKGFFEQYRYRDDFADYGIPPVNSNGDTILTNDTLVRRRWLDNDFFGGIFTAKYQSENTAIQFGAGLSRYIGDHFGRVIRAQGFDVTDLNRRYYDDTGTKDDFNVYAKVDQQLGQLGLFADMQLRTVSHSILGKTSDLINVDVSREFSFFNPKLGASYTIDDKQQVYASVAVANREPDRNDILNITDTATKAERLVDYEAGYRYLGSKWKIDWNNYYMSYDDQLVLTGAVDDVGNARRINVEDSYRLGTELSVTGEVYKDIYWNVNTTLSTNKIAAFEEKISDISIQHENTDIAYSPSVIVGNAFLYKPSEALELELSTKYVGKQYLDNTSNENRKLDPYTYTNLRATYDMDLPSLDGVRLTLQVLNLFDAKYSTNGYTFSYDAGEIITENYLFPQAGIHFMLGAQLRL